MPDNNDGVRPTVRAVQREHRADLPHGGVRTPAQRPALVSPLAESPELLRFLALLQDVVSRLDTLERGMDARPAMDLKTRKQALAAARAHVGKTQGGRLPMSPADRIRAEVLVAWFLVGEHGPDPD